MKLKEVEELEMEKVEVKEKLEEVEDKRKEELDEEEEDVDVEMEKVQGKEEELEEVLTAVVDGLRQDGLQASGETSVTIGQ